MQKPNYLLRLGVVLALVGAVYWYGLPYLLLGSRGYQCDYYGLQGHRVFYGAWADCPTVKVWELKYPILAWYDGDTMVQTPANNEPRTNWLNKPSWEGPRR